jgi:hypothetical protein
MYMGAYIWVLIPIAAILSGAFREWLKFRAKQRELGVSTRELEKEVAGLARAKAELTERVQNLETIVVSQTWQVLQDKGLAPAERELKLATAAHRELGGASASAAHAAHASHPTDLANQQRAEQLARRLQP